MKSPASMRASNARWRSSSSAERTAFGASSRSLPMVSIACVYIALLRFDSLQVPGEELLDAGPEVDAVLDLEPAVALARVHDVLGVVARGAHRGADAVAVVD